MNLVFEQTDVLSVSAKECSFTTQRGDAIKYYQAVIGSKYDPFALPVTVICEKAVYDYIQAFGAALPTGDKYFDFYRLTATIEPDRSNPRKSKFRLTLPAYFLDRETGEMLDPDAAYNQAHTADEE